MVNRNIYKYVILFIFGGIMGKKMTSIYMDEEVLKYLKLRGMTISGALTAYANILKRGDNVEREINDLAQGNLRLQSKLTEYAARIHALERKND